METIFRNLKTKMANPHHRSKHKTYVQQKHMHQAAQHHHAAPVKANKKAAIPLAAVGAVAGLLVAYIANQENIMILVAGLVIGAAAGYLFGSNIDRGLAKKK